MLDLENGFLSINSDLQIMPAFSLKDLKSREDYHLWQQEKKMKWDTWFTATYKDVKERRLRIRLHFYNEKLEQVFLFYFLPNEIDRIISGGYFPYNDSNRHKYHSEILNSELGTAKNLSSWGRLGLGVLLSENLSFISIDYTITAQDSSR